MGNLPGIAQKRGERIVKDRLLPAGCFHSQPIFSPAAKALREKFTDFHGHILNGITAYVSDTFPIGFLSPADNIPPLQRGAVGQCMEHLRLMGIPPTIGAYLSPCRVAHTVHAKIGGVSHCVPSRKRFNYSSSSSDSGISQLCQTFCTSSLSSRASSSFCILVIASSSVRVV